jgi:hypothetical protein
VRLLILLRAAAIPAARFNLFDGMDILFDGMDGLGAKSPEGHPPPLAPRAHGSAKIDWSREPAMGPIAGPALDCRTPKGCRGP